MLGTRDIGVIKTDIVLGFIELTVFQGIENYKGSWINDGNNLLR